ncbi:hypothetical protein [Actinophytocola oryzae]|uniref:Uncharacterized protein n=1 Tax=Actinophytocola oryzae TaxID=502181 RepID=A0A4R7VXV8_9PSEU|nr:hypothetical protein [Actinophytocola oryzae]TDV54996.1 hypothetical protein CLV71_103237 [Actinophytocola oryzae]
MALEPANFQIQHDVLDAAAGTQVPRQSSALGDTRQALLSRTVDPSAFGDVDFSAQAGQNHQNNIQRGADGLENSKQRLDGIGQNIARTTQETRGLDDRQAKDQREQTAQITEVADKQGQRDKAMSVLDGIIKKNPVSVAAVARRQLQRWTDNTGWSDWARNFQSGNIGDHYEKDAAELLAKPPTDANLRSLADSETKFWQSPEGSTLGGWASADWRYDRLIDGRTWWLNEMPADRANDIRTQLGLH